MKIADVIDTQLKGLWGTELSDNQTGIPVIKTNNMTYEGIIDYSSVTYRNIPVDVAESNYLLSGDLLIEKSGGTKTHTVGYVNYFNGEDTKYVCNNFILAIRPNKQLVDCKYLFYQLKYMYENGYFSDCYNRTTGIQNLQVKTYLNKDIKIADISTQNNISKQLDSITDMILLKKRAISALDELVKSRFIGMFGDSLSNKSLHCKISDIATATIGLTYKPQNVSEQGTIVLRSGNIQNAELYLEKDIVRVSNINIPENKYVMKDDILMCSRNGSARLVGKCCLIPSLSEAMSFGAFMTVIRTNYPYFLNSFFNSAYFTQQLTGTQTASVNQITTGMLNDYAVIEPRIEEENEFAEFVKQIDKSKFIVRQQIKDLQELLDSKMDEYFG